jgi:hypothetical protein
MAVGCTAPGPAPEPPAEAQVPPAPVVAPPRADACAPCAALKTEIAQLQRRLAERESELSDLRAQRQEQAKALEESARQAARTTARLRRLATRASAASYIAEVEVSMATARSAPNAESEQATLNRAQQLLDASRAPYDKGDYAGAIDRASQAAELIAKAAEEPAGAPARTGASPLEHLAVPIRLRVRIDSHLRSGPSARAAILAVLTGGTPVLANARRDGWLRVATPDSRSGWVYRPLLEPR